jgi:predicted Zn-dependent protease
MRNERESALLDDRIMELAVKGLPAREVAERLGESPSLVHKRMGRMRASGLLPPLAVCRGTSRDTYDWRSYVRHRYGTKIGSMRDLLGTMSAEELDQLLRQIPKGASIADYVAAIVKDTLADENPLQIGQEK